MERVIRAYSQDFCDRVDLLSAGLDAARRRGVIARSELAEFEVKALGLVQAAAELDGLLSKAERDPEVFLPWDVRLQDLGEDDAG